MATLEAPIQTTLPGVVKKQRYVKIVDADDRRVVTVIEVLSPSNKSSGEDGQHYRLKREAYIANGVSLVEIDLLRSGQRPPLGDPSPPISDYYLLVHRGWEDSRLGIWPLSIRDPFPLQIPVPLDPDVPDSTLDLRVHGSRLRHRPIFGATRLHQAPQASAAGTGRRFSGVNFLAPAPRPPEQTGSAHAAPASLQSPHQPPEPPQ